MARSAIAALALASLCSAQVQQAELSFAPVHHASSGWYTLTIGQKSLTASGSYGVTTRGYSGGPTFRMKPGESLQVHLVNDLLASNNVACTVTAGEFCESTVTNLHTHGLHVSSKGVSDGLTYDSDNVFALLAPGGNQKSFEFTIPDYHMGGTHWYHPHHHHATALQAGGGAAGVLIVDDPAGYLPSEYSSMAERVLFIAGHNLQTLQTIAQSARSGLLEDAATTATNAGLDTNLFLVNGQRAPTMTISSHVWYRLRMVYAAVEQTLNLEIAGDPDCTLQLIAKDGVYLREIPRTITTIHMYPGSRADVAVSCQCPTYPCSGTLTSVARRRLQGPGGGGPRPPGGGGAGPAQAGMAAVAVDVMSLTVEQTIDGVVTTLPITTLARPCYLADLRSATVPAANSGALDLNGGQRAVRWDGVGESMTYANVHADGGTMDSWPPITSFATGSVYEMDVTGANAHPLHLHVNPFQIITMGADDSLSGGYFQVGDWHDTLYLEGLNGQLRVRMNTDVFTGKMVVHCHILEHEDEGMMGYISLTGVEGATYAAASTLEPTCYSSAYDAGPTAAPTPSPTGSGEQAGTPTPSSSPTVAGHQVGLVTISTTLSEPVVAGATSLPVQSQTGFDVGDSVTICCDVEQSRSETRTIASFGSINLDQPLLYAYPAAASVSTQKASPTHSPTPVPTASPTGTATGSTPTPTAAGQGGGTSADGQATPLPTPGLETNLVSTSSRLHGVHQAACVVASLSMAWWQSW